MKFLPLLLANLRRKKIRTVLTMGSFMVAMFLFGLLAGGDNRRPALLQGPDDGPLERCQQSQRCEHQPGAFTVAQSVDVGGDGIDAPAQARRQQQVQAHRTTSGVGASRLASTKRWCGGCRARLG